MSGISNVLNTKTNIVTLSNEQLKQLNAQTGKQSLSLSAGDTVSGKIVSITNSELYNKKEITAPLCRL